MPMHPASRDVLPAQLIPSGGQVGIQNDLISAALHGPLAFLKDGRHFIVQFDVRPPVMLDPHTQLMRYQVNIRWLVASPAQAAVGDIVPMPTLRPDPKPANVQPFESTLQPQNWRFEPTPEGWRRMT